MIQIYYLFTVSGESGRRLEAVCGRQSLASTERFPAHEKERVGDPGLRRGLPRRGLMSARPGNHVASSMAAATSFRNEADCYPPRSSRLHQPAISHYESALRPGGHPGRNGYSFDNRSTGKTKLGLKPARLLTIALPRTPAWPPARPTPSCRSRPRRSPVQSNAATRSGHIRPDHMWSRRLVASSPHRLLGRMGHRPSSFRGIPTARRLRHRNSAPLPPAPPPSIGNRPCGKAARLCLLDESNQHARHPGRWRVVGADPDYAGVTDCLAGQPYVGPEPSRIPAVHFDCPTHRGPLRQLVSQRRQWWVVTQAPRQGRRDRDDGPPLRRQRRHPRCFRRHRFGHAGEHRCGCSRGGK